jgi:hypothetical protein
MNLYGYCGNDPINNEDQDGEKKHRRRHHKHIQRNNNSTSTPAWVLYQREMNNNKVLADKAMQLEIENHTREFLQSLPESIFGKSVCNTFISKGLATFFAGSKAAPNLYALVATSVEIKWQLDSIKDKAYKDHDIFLALLNQATDAKFGNEDPYITYLRQEYNSDPHLVELEIQHYIHLKDM